MMERLDEKTRNYRKLRKTLPQLDYETASVICHFTSSFCNIPSNSSCCLECLEQTSLLVACAPKGRMQGLYDFQIMDAVIKD